MVLLILSWTFLLIVSVIIGSAVIAQTNFSSFGRVGDRFIFSAWLGILLLAIFLLSISLALPLSPAVGLVSVVILATLSLASPRSRAELRSLLAKLTPLNVIIFFLITLAVAAITVTPVTWFDTGLYHAQLVQWLNQFGTLPGLALIHARLGFTSSWFALTAPFDTGAFAGKTHSLSGGLVLVFVIIQLFISLTYVFQKQARLADYFTIFSISLYLPVLLLMGIYISSSPDAPLISVITVIAASILLILDNGIKSSNTQLGRATEIFIPVILAAGAFTIKLSGLPVLAGVLLLAVLENRSNRRNLVSLVLAAGVLILPFLLSSIVTSGCPLFHSTLLCMDLPWSVGKEQARASFVATQNWYLWGYWLPPQNKGWFEWVPRWIDIERQSTYLLILTVIAAIALLGTSKKYPVRGWWYILIIAALGIGVVMYGGPTLRFGLGYFVLLPSLFLAALFQYKSPFLPMVIWSVPGVLLVTQKPIPQSFFILIGFAVLLSIALFIFNNKNARHQSYRFSLLTILFTLTFTTITLKNSGFSLFPTSNLPENILLPPSPPLAKGLVTRQSNNIEYRLVLDNLSQCWTTQLPCTPYLALPQEKLYLRQPEIGIAGGFIRKK